MPGQLRIEEVFSRKAAAGTSGLTFAGVGSTCGIINPETSKFLERWDQVAMVSLCFVAIVSPVQIAMLEPGFDAMFVVNSVIDCVFFVDMLLQFFIMYPKHTSYGVSLEYRHGHIVKNYMMKWFCIDLLSVVPFDLIRVLSDENGMQGMKAVKIVRLLRLIKLMRIMRASRLFRRFEHRMPISYKKWALFRFFVVLMIITHWMANLWALTLVLVDEGQGVPRWVDTFKVLEEDVDTKTENTPWKLYIASVYFTSYTLTSVGYGDIGPKNITERVVCTIMIVISGTSWAVVLGQVCGIVANMNADEQAFRKNMDELNAMMSERAFPQDMCTRLRTFFHSNKRAQRRRRLEEQLHTMSPGLQGEVAIQVNRIWISKVSLLRVILQQVETSTRGRFMHQFLVDVCLALQPEVHSQAELFGKPHVLYILNQGLVSRPPRLHMQASVWGMDFVLTDERLLEPPEAYALTYVELTVLTRDAFFQTVTKYRNQCPKLLRRVRYFCVWLALQRAVIKEAKGRQMLVEARGLAAMWEQTARAEQVSLSKDMNVEALDAAAEQW